MIIPLIEGIISVIVGFFAYIMAGGLIKILLVIAGVIFVKFILKIILFTVVPILLYNIFSDYIVEMMDWAVTYIQSQGVLQGSGLTIELTGFAGWIAQQIGIASSLAMYMTAIAVRFALNVMRL